MILIHAIQRAITDRAARWAALLGFAAGLPLYLVMLPASLTSGHISWSNMKFLNIEMVSFSIIMSVLLSLTLLLMIFLIREGRRASKGLVTGGALLGLITPLLCCSPILPLTLGFLAIVFPTLSGMTAGPVQAFIARHEFAFLVSAVIIMVLALYQNASQVLKSPSCKVR